MTNKRLHFRLRLVNRLDHSRTVVLEPWTGEYRLGAGEQLDIAVIGTPATPLEIELANDRIVVTAFDTDDALLTAYRDGVELRSEHGPA
jgi:hypothetical protein